MSGRPGQDAQASHAPPPGAAEDPPGGLGVLWHRVLGPLLAHRVALVCAATFLLQFLPSSRHYHTGTVRLIDMWVRWDAIYYARVAVYGYGAGGGSDAFFPLFPGLSAFFGYGLGQHLAALLVANAMCVVALYLLYRWAHEAYGEAVAKRSVLVYIAFPTSFFLTAPYAESTYLAGCIGVFYFAHRRPGVAACLVFATCLARPQGFLCTTVPFGMAWLVRSRRLREFPWFALSSFPALGALLAIHLLSSGDALGFAHTPGVQNLRVFWEQDRAVPSAWAVLWDEGMGPNLMRRLLNWSALGLAAVGTFVLARARAIEEATLVVMTMALPLYFHHSLFDAASSARYALLAFPLVVLLARVSQQEGSARHMDIGFSMLQVVLLSLYSASHWAE